MLSYESELIMLCELISYKKSTFKLHYHAHTRMALGIRDILVAAVGLIPS